MKIWTSACVLPRICVQKIENGSRALSSLTRKPSDGESSSATPVRCLEASVIRRNFSATSRVVHHDATSRD